MNSGLRSICDPETVCKCCGATAYPYGVVDFHKNCEFRRPRVLGVSGVPIYYHRCPRCRFLFTTALDHFSREDFLKYIYNDEYLLVDPDYQGVRARSNASVIAGILADHKPGRILDYGGGRGDLAEQLQLAGYADVQTYDPFVASHSARPSGRFDCILSFEVVEHSTDPEATFADMVEFLEEPGIIMFSTVLQPADIDSMGLNWWYAGPRNGHVSLYSAFSLRAIADSLGFGFASHNNTLHVFYREIPEFARHFLIPVDQYLREEYTHTVMAY